MVTIYGWFKTKVFKYKCRGHKDRRVLIQRKMVGNLFFLHLKSERSMNFEHKRGVPGKGKTENFGCFMAFSRSPNSPNREFKTKKHPSFSGVFYTQVVVYQRVKTKMVAGPRIELGTRGFSVLCSTDWAILPPDTFTKHEKTEKSNPFPFFMVIFLYVIDRKYPQNNNDLPICF